MALQTGTTLGHYRVLALIGAGGMGEVYRATDAKLNRDVALKLLPAQFASDGDRMERFQREAHVLASLNHSHIAAIYGVEDSGSMRALVMELVEGPTLADRIAEGPMSVEDVLTIAKQIAEALEYAHERGVIHRDLKPANVKLTREGQVKVLDFGLAKALSNESSTTVMSNLPTLSMAATQAGVILGTAAYMSPEQAKGKTVDRRADIWAFGVVVYEMLTGRMLFTGETPSETMAHVMVKEPDWSALPASTPARIRDLMRRCLIKDTRSRLQAIGDARIAIEEEVGYSETLVPSPGVPYAGVTKREHRTRFLLGVAVILVAALSVPAWLYLRLPPADAREFRLQVVTPQTPDPVHLALSPDGRRLVFVGSAEGRTQLWLRSLDSVTAQPLSGTDGGTYPFWSPDSRWIAFNADGKLKRVDAASGATEVIADAPTGRGGTWNPDGVILFAPTSTGELFRVPAGGGQAVAVTHLAPGQQSHRLPQFLPDGKSFLFYSQGSADQRGIYFGSIDGPEPRRLMDGDSHAAYSPNGHLLFLREGRLMAQLFDPDTASLLADSIQVADQVGLDPATNVSGFSVGKPDILAYRSGAGGLLQLTWLDRSGRPVSVIGPPDASGPLDPELSPDGRRIAETRTVNGNTDIWVLEAARGTASRLTLEQATDRFPVWSPDGERIVFGSARKAGVTDVFQKLSTSGAGAEDLLLESPLGKAPSDWSPDGRFVLYRVLDPKTRHDIWLLPLSGDRKPVPFAAGPFDEREGQFSPDGRWVAYQSNETGRFEIYIQPFPGPGGKWQVSTNGGAQARWRRDGKELFYVALDSRLMATPILLDSSQKAPDIGSPAALFPLRTSGGPVLGISRQQYDVSPDGQRFLANVPAVEASTAPITVILNWKPTSR